MRGISLARQDDYLCCHRALRHYENFRVVSFFVPTHLRPHFWAIYAFCRAVDDLGDEYGGDRLRALSRFEGELRLAFQGKATVPEFRALAETIDRFRLPMEDFLALIEANRRDQGTVRYARFDELLDYCRHSADPVGHLVLALFGYRDDERRSLSDATSTGLQLVNFWQDLDRDLAQGRCYLPEEDLDRFQVTPAMLEARQPTPEFRRLMAFEVERAQAWLSRGAALEGMVPWRLSRQLRLYRLGGSAILQALRRQAFNPFLQRPTVGPWDTVRMVWQVLAPCVAL